MLNQIIAGALRHRIVVAAAALVIAVVGVLSVLRMPIDVLPDLDRPIVTILAEAPGMQAEDVEQLVSWPIEQAANGALGVFRVRSNSASGLAVVFVEFEWDVDIYRARQIVAEKMQLVDLPEGVHAQMAPVSSIMGQILVVGFRSGDGTTSQSEIRRIVDRDVRPRILSVSGVAQVVTTGARATELQVIVDAARLRAAGLTLPELRDAITRANVNVFGGTLPLGERAPLVTLPGRIDDARELGAAVVQSNAERPIRVDDLADVQFGPSLIGVGDAGIDGEPGVLLVVTKQPGVDTLLLTEKIEEELDFISSQLPGDVIIQTELFKQSAFIHRAIDNVMDAVRDGSILVILVLFAFLLNLRTTLITLTAIPLSVAVAALVFSAFGLTINTMTLGGLAVAIGTLVDDAIVDVENVHRRLWQNAHATEKRSLFDVVYSASAEIRKPVMYGTLLVTVVYVPLFFLGGIEGRLFVPIGLAYIVSVMASLLVALTVTPVLCYWLLGSVVAHEQNYGGRLVAWLHAAVERVARIGMGRPMHAIAIIAAFTICSVYVLATRGTTFLPPFNEGSAQVNLMLPPDASLETSSAFGTRLERALMSVDGVASVARRTGRTEGDEHVMPTSMNEAIVTFDDDSDRSREEILDDIRHELEDQFPGVPTETEQPLAHLLSHMLSGVTSQVSVKIAGSNLAVLRDLAARAEASIESIPGVVDLYTEPLVLVDQIEVRPDRERLARLGITVAELAETVELALGGQEISRYRAGRVTYPIKVRLRPEDRADPERIAAIPVRSAEGGLVRVTDVATVRRIRSPNEVRRENVSRRIVVQHNVSGRALGDVVADVESALEPLRAELEGMAGYSIRIGGQFRAQQEATRVILALSVLSLIAMVLILYLHFRSMRLAVIVLASRPIALLGAAAAVAWTGQTLSVATLVGLIALLGMATRNAILLVDHTFHLVADEGRPFSPGTLIRAARERVVPVTMTALTSGIGLLPLAIAADQPGREILYPVATVIVGGLVTNTLLDFLITPGLLWTFARGVQLQQD